MSAVEWPRWRLNEMGSLAVANSLVVLRLIEASAGRLRGLTVFVGVVNFGTGFAQRRAAASLAQGCGKVQRAAHSMVRNCTSTLLPKVSQPASLWAMYAKRQCHSKAAPAVVCVDAMGQDALAVCKHLLDDFFIALQETRPSRQQRQERFW